MAVSERLAAVAALLPPPVVKEYEAWAAQNENLIRTLRQQDKPPVSDAPGNQLTTRADVAPKQQEASGSRLRSPPPAAPTDRSRIAHSGGKITHNKESAIHKFTMRLLREGKDLTEEQAAAARAAGIEVDRLREEEQRRRLKQDADAKKKIEEEELRRKLLASMARKATGDSGGTAAAAARGGGANPKRRKR